MPPGKRRHDEAHARDVTRADLTHRDGCGAGRTIGWRHSACRSTVAARSPIRWWGLVTSISSPRWGGYRS